MSERVVRVADGVRIEFDGQHRGDVILDADTVGQKPQCVEPVAEYEVTLSDGRVLHQMLSRSDAESLAAVAIERADLSGEWGTV